MSSPEPTHLKQTDAGAALDRPDSPGGPHIASMVRSAVAVLAAILVAFALDAWWGDRSERDLAMEELRRVQEDLLGNNGQLRTRIGAISRIEASVANVSADLQAAAEGIAIDVADTLLAALTTYPSHNPTTAAITQMLNSGRLSLVGDGELSNALSRWPGLWSDVQDTQDTQRTIVTQQLMPYFVERDVDLSRVLEFGIAWIEDPAEAELLPGSTSLEVSGGLKTLVAARLRNLRLLLRGLQNFRDYEEDLAAMIEAALS